MCLAVMDIRDNEIETTYFSNPNALLPIKYSDGQFEYLKWGRRVHEKSEFPTGRYAKYESIRKGIWNQFFPKPVKILVSNFAETDKFTDELKWKPIIKGSYIQGLVATINAEKRVYIVSIQPPGDSIFSKWPRILTARD